MRTVKDIIKLLSNQVNSNELSAVAAASDLNEVEIEDENFEKIETTIKSLMDADAAVANADIVNKVFEDHKSRVHNQALFSIEKRLSELAKKTNINLDGKDKAHDMLDVINTNIEAKIASSEGGDQKLQELVTSLKEDKETLSKQLEAKQEEFTNKLTEQEALFNKEKIRTEFNLATKSLNWADHYKTEKVNRALIDSIYNEISGEAELKIVKGELVPFQKDLPEKELYNGNKKITFQDLLASKVQDYIKKSEAAPAAPPAPSAAPPQQTQAERRKAAMQRAG